MPVLRSEQGCACYEGPKHRVSVALGPVPNVGLVGCALTHETDVGFALLRLNLNVADKLHMLQRPGVACVASEPCPHSRQTVFNVTLHREPCGVRWAAGDRNAFEGRASVCPLESRVVY